jgi:hypothetical protein
MSDEDKILIIHFNRMAMDEYADFFRTLYALLLDSGQFLKSTVGAANIAELKLWLDRLEELMRWPGMRVISGQLRAADRLLDHALSELAVRVRNIKQFSTDPALIASAERVLDMLKRYGKVGDKTYTSQKADITSILEHFNGDFAADVTALGLGVLLAALQAAFDSFIALLAEYDAVKGTKPKYSFAVVKKAIVTIYRKIEEIINSGAALKLSQDFGIFIAKINPEIERINRENQRRRHSLKHAQIAPIADQAFTEFPVTPALRVYYITKKDGTKELFLGQDYNVTYKNNIEVGQAQATIHGKGDYRDSQTVTFTIRRGPIDAKAAAAAEEEFRRELEAQAKAAEKGEAATGEGI